MQQARQLPRLQIFRSLEVYSPVRISGGRSNTILAIVRSTAFPIAQKICNMEMMDSSSLTQTGANGDGMRNITVTPDGVGRME